MNSLLVSCDAKADKMEPQTKAMSAPGRGKDEAEEDSADDDDDDISVGDKSDSATTFTDKSVGDRGVTVNNFLKFSIQVPNASFWGSETPLCLSSWWALHFFLLFFLVHHPVHRHLLAHAMASDLTVERQYLLFLKLPPYKCRGGIRSHDP
jgi:hypothetical protein